MSTPTEKSAPPEKTTPAENALSDDAFLGGRLRVLQPEKGFRAGIDSVILAAAVPARAGERVLEGGAGPGVAALCLLARVPEARLVGVEASPEMAALAMRNAARNQLAEKMRVIAADITRIGKKDDPARLQPGSFHHAFANPPYHPANAAMPSPHAGKAAAHVRPPSALAEWVRALARMVRPRGTVTIIQPAEALPELLAAFTGAHLGDIRIAPLWPRAGAPAGRVLVRGARGRKGPARLLPGLVLHEPRGGFTQGAERILRHGGAFDWRDA